MALQNRPLAWGHCLIHVKKAGAAAFTALPVAPIKDSTSVAPQEGAKEDAPLEGGGVYASRKEPDTYSLKADFYLDPTVKAETWFEGVTEGQLPDVYSVKIVPENKDAFQVTLPAVSLSLSKEYTASRGIILHLTGAVLTPEKGDAFVYEKQNDPSPESEHSKETGGREPDHSTL